MSPRGIATAVLVIAGAAVCARLGFWQIDRLHEKRRLNAEQAAALAAPALTLEADPTLERAHGRRVIARGRYDETRQVLLSNRAHDGTAGVEVVTPLVLADGGTAVLVDRGWIPAPDAATADPRGFPEPGPHAVVGMPFALRRGAGGPALRALPAGPGALWSARWLDLDSLRGRFPYALAPFALRELPGPGVPTRPARAAPRPLDEWTHVSYAAQWFLFGAILLGGSAALAWSRRRAGALTLVESPARPDAASLHLPEKPS